MLLEIARWMAAHDADATVRFAFWAGEEEGLYGSRGYAQALTEAERDAMVAYLDLDMVASPNFVRYVVADAPMDPSAAEGNETIAGLFTRAFDDMGLEAEPIETYGGADHGSFAAVGIPVGGLFAGSAEVKTPEQEDAYGGEAGEPVDACYHQACDTSGNVSEEALGQFAAAYVDVLTELASVDTAG
jgi:Zn-dependent M28 family amino/carboxypeptidase